jgi:hypothetical protein
MRHVTPIADVVPGFFDYLTSSVAFVRPRRVPSATPRSVRGLRTLSTWIRRVESIQELSPAILSA